MYQVVVGSFLPGHQQEQKHKKQRIEIAPVVAPVNLLSAAEIGRAYSGVKPLVNASSSFYGGNAALNDPMQAFKNSTSDNKTPTPEEDESGDPSLSNGEASS